MADSHTDSLRLAEVVSGLGLHQHLCVIYDTQEELFAAALPYLRTGLERGEKCIYIVDENTAAAVLDALRQGGTDVDRYLRTGALAIADKYETYLRQGRFDPDGMISFMSQTAAAGGASRFSGWRTLLAEMTWALEASDGPVRLIEYESKVNHFFRDHAARGVCLYNRARFSPELLLGVIRTHPQVVYGGTVCKNPYYIPPDEYLKPNQAAREVERLLRNILEWERAQQAVRRSEDHLRLVIDTIPIMAWSVRPDGTVDFLNQRWMDFTGLSLEQYVKEQTGPIHPEDIPRVMEKWQAGMLAGESYEVEMRLQRADGEYRWFLIRTVPLRDDRGDIVKWYGSSVDIEDRKRAEAELQRSRDKLRSLAAQLQKIREEERTRVAREIHDELGQALTAIKLDLSALFDGLPADGKKQSEAILKLVDETIQSVRRIATELRPVILDELGLVAAVEWACEEFQARTGIPCRLDLPSDDTVIDPERATALFRIFQETLTNVARHANATEVDVRLAEADGDLTLEVHDNGKGIGEDQLSAGGSLGILGMRERALLLGGELTITSAPGNGTTVTARIPEADPTPPREGK